MGGVRGSGLLWLGLAAGSVLASPSPQPADVLPESAEFTVPGFAGGVRGAYQGLKFGNLLIDTGPSALEETAPGEVRRWVYQAAGGTVTVGGSVFSATCVRATRHNVLAPQKEFQYELRISALEGGCTSRPEKRDVELVFVMDDFVIRRFKEGSVRFYGQSSNLMLFPQLLRSPDRVEAVAVEGGLSLGGRLVEMPAVVGVQVEILLRPKGEMSCLKAKFDPDKDPYSSVFVQPDSTGKWGAVLPKLGGAVCLRVVGGGWKSALTGAKIP